MKYLIHPQTKTILPAHDWFVLVETDEDVDALAEHLDEIVGGREAVDARLIPAPHLVPGNYYHDLRVAADAVHQLAEHIYANHPETRHLTVREVILYADHHLSALPQHEG